MKRDIARYVAECDVCRRIKGEHQRPAGTLQPLPIPEWKWDKVSMDFITGFPKTQKGNDAIFVVIDRLSKVAHFLPIHESITASQLADLYVSRVVSLHGVPLEINSDRGSLFTSSFWQSFQNAMELISPLVQLSILNLVVKLKGLTKFWKTCSEPMLSHSERIGRSLFHSPSLLITTVFQSSLNMVPFEFLYGRRCRTPHNWSETGERQLFGPDMIKEAEDQVRIVRDQLKAAQSLRKATMIVIIGKKATICMRRLTFGLLL